MEQQEGVLDPPACLCVTHRTFLLLTLAQCFFILSVRTAEPPEGLAKNTGSGPTPQFLVQ